MIKLFNLNDSGVLKQTRTKFGPAYLAIFDSIIKIHVILSLFEFQTFNSDVFFMNTLTLSLPVRGRSSDEKGNTLITTV